MEKTEPPIVAPSQRSLDELAQTLANWLPTRIEGASDIAITDLRYPRGAGLSHETILFTASWRVGGVAHERGLVVRIKPRPDKSVYLDDQFVDQFRIMRAARQSGHVRVAEVLWLEEDPAILGAPFFVMERMDGRVPVSYPSYVTHGWLAEATPAERRVAWEDSVRQLAAIQLIPHQDVPFLDLGTGGTGFEQEIDRWRRYVAWITEPGPLPFVERAFAEILRTAPANPPPGIVWGDARIGNMMFDDSFRVLAVMDWEQVSLGGALHDLGWWLSNEHHRTVGSGVARPDGIGSAEETCALWSEVTGIPVTDIEWYTVFACFKMNCLRTHMLDANWYPPTPGNDWGECPGWHFVAEHLGIAPPEPMPRRIRWEDVR